MIVGAFNPTQKKAVKTLNRSIKARKQDTKQVLEQTGVKFKGKKAANILAMDAKQFKEK